MPYVSHTGTSWTNWSDATTSTSYVPPQDQFTNSWGIFTVGAELALFRKTNSDIFELPEEYHGKVDEYIRQHIMFYKVKSINLTKQEVIFNRINNDGTVRNTDADVSFEELQHFDAFTRDQMKAEFMMVDMPHAQVCSKIKQLYRKFNSQSNTFKFQGV